MKRVLIWTKVGFVFAMASVAVAADFYSMGELRGLLRKVKTDTANCQREKCENLKVLKEYEKVLNQAIDLQPRVAILTEENLTLRDQIETVQKSLPLTRSTGCQKTQILKEKMIDLGINENGSQIYSKRPAGMDGAHCWANSKKKKEATAVLCEFPLAINILTKGGKATDITERRQEYMFDLKACNLVSVKITEESAKKKKETLLSLSTCLEQWNKRTADASMTKAQVSAMEETIKQCFKYQLLPADEKQILPLQKDAQRRS